MENKNSIVNSHCILITHKEWLDWLAFGYLRTSPSRISYFDGTGASFEQLLSHSTISISSLDEEDGFLIAKLVDDYSRVAYYISQTSSTYHISIRAVQGFYALTKRALSLLENEILHSRSVVEYDANIESLWTKWVSSQIEVRDYDKGNKFLEILGYPKFPEAPEITNDSLFNTILSSYNREHLPQNLREHDEKAAFPWLFINYEFGRSNESIYKIYKAERKGFQALSDAYSNQMDSYLKNDITSLTDQPIIVAEKLFFDRVADSESYFLASSFLVHYYNLIDNEIEISLEFLKKDLAFLDSFYSNNITSRRIAYHLGKRLNEVYLNSLYIAKNIEQQPSNVFDINFFSKLRKVQLFVLDFNVDEVEIIVNDVKLKAEEIECIYNEGINKSQELQSVMNTPEQNTSNDKDTSTNPQSGEGTANGLKAENVSTNDSESQSTENNTNPDQLESETKDLSTNEDSISSSQGDDQPAQEAIKDLTGHDTSKNQSTPQDDKDNTDTVYSENQNIARQGDKYSDDHPTNEEKATHNKPSDPNRDELNKLGDANQPDPDSLIDLALRIHSGLSNDEKTSGKYFIKQFMDGVDNATKEKLKHKTQKEFFNKFGTLIGDAERYKNITYVNFKKILDDSSNGTGLLIY